MEGKGAYKWRGRGLISDVYGTSICLISYDN